MHTMLILGAGKVGTTMAIDLAGDPELQVRIADRDSAALARAAERASVITGRTIETQAIDLSDDAGFAALVREADVVLGALSSTLGFRTLRRVIEAGRPYCDISFMPEDALALDELAKQHDVPAIVDCGVAPGLSNLLAGQAVQDLDHCESIEIYVGGLPRERFWPYEYKAGFSPHDVIEEYLRPARLVEGGSTITREALSEIERIDFDGDRFPGVGTLEAFNTDGLRSLISTLSVPHMKEKTMRYPGHAELMRILRHTGFFSTEPVRAGSAMIRPLDLTSALLFPLWEFGEGEKDVTVMHVTAEGTKGGKRVRLEWDLFDEADGATACSSMSRTTAFPATICARLLAQGRIPIRGVLPPELLAPLPGLTSAVLQELKKRGVHVKPSRHVVSGG